MRKKKQMVWKAWTKIHSFNVIKSLAKPIVGLSLIALLSQGCTQNYSFESDAPFSIAKDKIILVKDDKAFFDRAQRLIIQLSAMLENDNLSNQYRAQIFYELGVLYDSIGLELTATNMFLNSSVYDKRFAKPYSFNAIYQVKNKNYQDAIELFDAALELDSTDSYVYFSRAIVLYYAKRYQMSLFDIEKFYAFDVNDPYRILWFYFIEEKYLSKSVALDNLNKRYNLAKNKQDHAFAFMLIELFLDIKSEDDIFEVLKQVKNHTQLKNEMLCEAYFYLGKYKQEQGDIQSAFDYFRLAISTRVYGFLEYRYAFFELDAIRQ